MFNATTYTEIIIIDKYRCMIINTIVYPYYIIV